MLRVELIFKLRSRGVFASHIFLFYSLLTKARKLFALRAIILKQEEREMNYKATRGGKMQTIAAEIPHDLNPTSNYTNANVHRIKSFL